MKRFALVMTSVLFLSCGGSSERSGVNGGAKVRFQLGEPAAQGPSIQAGGPRCAVKSLRILDQPQGPAGYVVTDPVNVMGAEAIDASTADAGEDIIFANPVEVDVDPGGPRRFHVFGATVGCASGNYHLLHGISPEVTVSGATEVPLGIRVAKNAVQVQPSGSCGAVAPLGCLNFNPISNIPTADALAIRVYDPRGNLVVPVPTPSVTPASSIMSIQNLILDVPLILEIEWSYNGTCVRRLKQAFTPATGSVNNTALDLSSGYGC